MNQTRPIQEIFDIVIESGCYGEHEYYKPINDDDLQSDDCYWSEDVRDFMCGALSVAYYRELISSMEMDQTKSEIQKYLRSANRAYLSSALRRAGLPHDFNAKLAIYKDWANRPNLSNQTEEN